MKTTFNVEKRSPSLHLHGAIGGGLLVAGTGHIFGVAVNNQSSGDSTEVLTKGVDLAKDTSTFAEGDYVYWDNTAKLCTSTATSNTKIGVAALTTPGGVNAPGGLSGDATVACG